MRWFVAPAESYIYLHSQTEVMEMRNGKHNKRYVHIKKEQLKPSKIKKITEI
jgi:hypothetical protein